MAAPDSLDELSAIESGLVPVIDLSRLATTQGAELEAAKTEIAQQLNQACETIGFFVIKGHNIDQSILDGAWDSSRAYFDLPTEEKEKCEMTEDYPYGYMGYKHEQLSAGLGSERPPDLKESLNMGPGDPRSLAPARRWPAQPAELQPTWEAYYDAMVNLASTILSLCARGLGLEDTWFEDKLDHHQSALRALNYPVTGEKAKEGQFRASPHTDYGSITILRSGGPGLQVRNREGRWQSIDASMDVFVVNLGDLMPYWSNDRWVSTLHRVVYMEGDHLKRRQSMAFFHNVNADAMIECLPTCFSDANPKKYPPILAGEHLARKHKAASKK